MKGGFSPQAPGEFALLSWNGDSLELLAPGDLPAKARLVYDANVQSKPLFTKPVDRQLLQAPDPSPLQDMHREEAACPHLPDHKLQKWAQVCEPDCRCNGTLQQAHGATDQTHGSRRCLCKGCQNPGLSHRNLGDHSNSGCP